VEDWQHGEKVAMKSREALGKSFMLKRSAAYQASPGPWRKQGIIGREGGNMDRIPYARMCQKAWPILRSTVINEVYASTLFVRNREGGRLDACAFSTRPADISDVPSSAFPILGLDQIYDIVRKKLRRMRGEKGAFRAWTDARDAGAFEGLSRFDELSLALVMHLMHGLIWRGHHWQKPKEHREGDAGDKRILDDAGRAFTGERISYANPAKQFVLWGAIVHIVHDFASHARSSFGSTIIGFFEDYVALQVDDDTVRFCLLALVLGRRQRAIEMASRQLLEGLHHTCLPLIDQLFEMKAAPVIEYFQDCVRITRRGSTYHLGVKGQPIASFAGAKLVLYSRWESAGTVNWTDVMERYIQFMSPPDDREDFIDAAYFVLTHSCTFPVTIDAASHKIINSNLAEVLVSSKGTMFILMCCRVLHKYSDLIEVPEELREEVAGMLLEHRLDRANGKLR
jgi:hypothetical protein